MILRGTRELRLSAAASDGLRQNWFECRLSDVGRASKYVSPFRPALRRDAGVVERGGLENRCARKRTGGSNPSPSAIPLSTTFSGPIQRAEGLGTSGLFCCSLSLSVLVSLSL